MIGGGADELSVDELLAKLAEKGKKVKVLDENGDQIEADEEEMMATELNDRAEDGPADTQAQSTKKVAGGKK